MLYCMYALSVFQVILLSLTFLLGHNSPVVIVGSLVTFACTYFVYDLVN